MKKAEVYSCVLALILGTTSTVWAEEEAQIGIVGDSGATGAVADPEVDATILSLFKRGYDSFFPEDKQSQKATVAKYPDAAEFNITEPVEQPTRIFYASDEVDEDGKAHLEVQAKASAAMDAEPYSWGYMLARKMGVKPKNILMTSQDGQRVDSIYTQFKRLKEASPEHLPGKIFVSYTANDFCDEKALSDEPTEVVRQYSQRLKDQFEKVRSEMKAHPEGTDIYLLSPLPVLQVLTSESVQNKEIPFHDGTITCGRLRSGEEKKVIFGTDLIEKMNSMCGAILKTKPSDKVKLAKIETLFSLVIKAQADVLQDLQRSSSNNFRFNHIPEVSDIQLEAQDVANDCFHPGIAGHVKVVRKVLEKIQPQAPQP